MDGWLVDEKCVNAWTVYQKCSSIYFIFKYVNESDLYLLIYVLKLSTIFLVQTFGLKLGTGVNCFKINLCRRVYKFFDPKPVDNHYHLEWWRWSRVDGEVARMKIFGGGRAANPTKP